MGGAIGGATSPREWIDCRVRAAAHGLVLPLVTTASGTKFGKTEAGTIWLIPRHEAVSFISSG